MERRVGTWLLLSALAACTVAAPERERSDVASDPLQLKGDIGGIFLPPSPNVVTQHNDNARTGAQLAETVLHTGNVNSSTFGKIATRKLDGQIYGQPLYVANVDIGGRARNVVYLVTMKNSVYAFDADDTSPLASPIWSTPAFGQAFDLGKDSKFNGCNDISGPDGRLVGMTSTPVIDPTTNTMYVVAKLQTGAPNATFALISYDIRNGNGTGIVQIVGSAMGNGVGSVASSNPRDHRKTITFQAKYQHQRPGLLLSNGVLYIGFGSHCDRGPYHGWLFAYDAPSLKQRGVFLTTPNQVADQPDDEGGIWQAGQGPAADSTGSVFVMTGNGSFNGITNFGDSFIKLGFPVPNVLARVASFTPANQADLYKIDYDLGSAGALLVPGTNQILGGGKDGRLFLLDRTNLAKLDEFPGAVNGNIHGSPVFWNGPRGARVYIWGEDDQLKAFTIGGNSIGRTPETSNVPTTIPDKNGAMPGGFLSISANGSATRTGIVWASYPKTNANQTIAEGILYAFDAEDLRNVLWTSDQSRPGVDNRPGIFAKFVPPTIANGKVFVAGWSADDPDHQSGRLHIYGLLPECRPRTSCSGACETISDGCGGTLDCPRCAKGSLCVSSHCKRCATPNCVDP